MLNTPTCLTHAPKYIFSFPFEAWKTRTKKTQSTTPSQTQQSPAPAMWAGRPALYYPKWSPLWATPRGAVMTRGAVSCSLRAPKRASSLFTCSQRPQPPWCLKVRLSTANPSVSSHVSPPSQEYKQDGNV